MFLNEPRSVRLKRLLCVLGVAASLAACQADAERPAVETATSAETAGHGLSVALVSQDGLLTLSSSLGGPFHFAVQVPADMATAASEMKVSETPGLKVLFTALVPCEDCPSLEASPIVNCTGGLEGEGQDGLHCDGLPYVGYGTDKPHDVLVEQGDPRTLGLVYFHDVGTMPGEKVSVEYLVMAAVPADDGGCYLYYDFSRAPIEFVVGQELEWDASQSSLLGAAATGPVFAVDGFTSECAGGPCPAADCTLAAFPVPFVDFCPLPEKAGNSDAAGKSWWYQRCKTEVPGLSGYPTTD